MNRPETHLTGELGELRAAQLFVEQGWVVNKLFSDYGFDLLVQRTRHLAVTGDFALIQVKASRLRKSSSNDVYSLVMDAKDIVHWRSVSIPAFLVVVNVASGEIFLLDCHTLARKIEIETKPERRRCTIKFSRANLVSIEVMTQLSHDVAAFWCKLREFISITNVDVAGLAATGEAFGSMPYLGFIGTVVGYLVSYWDRPVLRRRELVGSSLRSNLGMLIGTDMTEKIIREGLEEAENDAPNTGTQADA